MNKEIKKRALSKAKSKVQGLSFIATLSFVFMALNVSTAFLPYLAVLCIPIRMLFVGGRAYALSEAWHKNHARLSSLFVCFRKKREFFAGLIAETGVAVLLMAAMIPIFLPGAGVSHFITALVLWGVLSLIVAVIEPYVFFAGAEDTMLTAMGIIKKGLSVALGNFGRIFMMLVSLYWFIFGAMAGMMALMLFGLNSANMLLNLGVSFAAGAFIFWAAAPYITMCEAGLARELFDAARKR